jgi:hypothetical protein
MMSFSELIDRTRKSIERRPELPPTDPFYLSPDDAVELLAELSRWDEPLSRPDMPQPERDHPLTAALKELN